MYRGKNVLSPIHSFPCEISFISFHTMTICRAPLTSSNHSYLNKIIKRLNDPDHVLMRVFKSFWMV